MTPGHQVFARARDLPEDWDKLVDGNPHLGRPYLEHAEKTHPCSQRYVLFRDDTGAVDGILMWHRQEVDIFTMSGLPLKWMLSINCVSPTASVSDPGISFRASARGRIEDYFKSLPGLTVALNLDPAVLPFSGWVSLDHLPGCDMAISWHSFDDYLAGMRSPYRRRCRLALRRSRSLTPRVLQDNAQFTEEMYALYEQVHRRAAHTLEKLGRAYFAGAFGKIAVFEDGDGRPRAFAQTYRHGDTYTFGFGGIDYSTQPRYDTYLRMLLWIVEDAIGAGCRHLKLGQTAEDAKCRLGAVPAPRTLQLRHSNPIAQACFRKLGFLLAEAQNARAYHVFRLEEGPA